ncbi:MAG: superoxide dismutase [Planctomycetota bacterium]
MAFTLPDLPYSHAALEPAIDSTTMQIHHGKHHQAYVDKANAALAETPFSGEADVEAVIRRLPSVPDAVRDAVRKNAGGHANHALFWSIMAPPNAGGGGEPSGSLAEALMSTFGSFDEFKTDFAAAAANRFGSGWAWLIVRDGKLVVGSTANQDSPLMGEDIAGIHGTPILGLDVWEHAYYLHYQNRRPDYIAAWWSVVNWNAVSERYEAALA